MRNLLSVYARGLQPLLSKGQKEKEICLEPQHFSETCHFLDLASIASLGRLGRKAGAAMISHIISEFPTTKLIANSSI